ncbi:hypothetical protein CASFOL_042972 [Castilleja foliolosa]|uniref:Uncharacterized protein n=1 Tax=Castilleja foliolosa TaxID=1961234 RepID=A0ABD3B7X6_9LAMI
MRTRKRAYGEESSSNSNIVHIEKNTLKQFSGKRQKIQNMSKQKSMTNLDELFKHEDEFLQLLVRVCTGQDRTMGSFRSKKFWENFSNKFSYKFMLEYNDCTAEKCAEVCDLLKLQWKNYLQMIELVLDVAELLLFCYLASKDDNLRRMFVLSFIYSDENVDMQNSKEDCFSHPGSLTVAKRDQLAQIFASCSASTSSIRSSSRKRSRTNSGINCGKISSLYKQVEKVLGQFIISGDLQIKDDADRESAFKLKLGEAIYLDFAGEIYAAEFPFAEGFADFKIGERPFPFRCFGGLFRRFGLGHWIWEGDENLRWNLGIRFQRLVEFEERGENGIFEISNSEAGRRPGFAVGT